MIPGSRSSLSPGGRKFNMGGKHVRADPPRSGNMGRFFSVQSFRNYDRYCDSIKLVDSVLTVLLSRIEFEFPPENKKNKGIAEVRLDPTTYG